MADIIKASWFCVYDKIKFEWFYSETPCSNVKLLFAVQSINRYTKTKALNKPKMHTIN